MRDPGRDREPPVASAPCPPPVPLRSPPRPRALRRALRPTPARAWSARCRSTSVAAVVAHLGSSDRPPTGRDRPATDAPSPGSRCGPPTSSPATSSPRCPAPARTAPTSPPRRSPAAPSPSSPTPTALAASRRHAALPGARPPPPRATCSGPWRRTSTATRPPHLGVIGVTGTSGKTTVAHLVEAGLAAAGRTTGMLGTVGIRIDGQPLPSAFTTPEAPDLQALFAVMREAGVTDVAMEVSSHALALGRVAGTRFAVGAFTNLSQDHLDFHHDMDDYFAAKAALFDGRAEHAVICVDDIWGARLAARTPARRHRGHHRGARRLARRRRRHRRRRRPALHRAHPGRPGAGAAAAARGVQRGQRAGRARLPGRGRRARRASRRSGSPQVAVPGRMQRIDVGQPFLAVVDYAHKPAAVAALLDTLRAQVPGRLITVLGCGGDRDRGKRPLMGAAAARRSDAARRHRRQPALRAPGRHPRRHARRAPWPSPATASCTRSATGARRSSPPSTRPAPATPSSSRARGTRPGRRWRRAASFRRRGRARRCYQRGDHGVLGAARR